MLSKADIRNMSMRNAYRRGTEIAHRRYMFSNCVLEDWSDRCILRAQVVSDNHDDTYEVTLYLNPSESVVTSYACTCPAYINYDGLCKHCVAVALAYRDSPEWFSYQSKLDAEKLNGRLEGLEEDTEAPGEGQLPKSVDGIVDAPWPEGVPSAGTSHLQVREEPVFGDKAAPAGKTALQGGFKVSRHRVSGGEVFLSGNISQRPEGVGLASKDVGNSAIAQAKPSIGPPAKTLAKPQRKTSAALVELIDSAARSKVAANRRQVALLLTLRHGLFCWEAEFDIVGPERSYVMQNISDFVRYCSTRAVHAYGKKLTLAHVPESFEPQSREVARFIVERVSQQGARARSSWHYDSYAPRRSLALTSYDLVELLDLYQTGTFVLREEASYLRRSVRGVEARVIAGDPVVRVSMRRTKDGQGYRFTYEGLEGLELIRAGERVYAWNQQGEFYRCTSEFAACADFLKAITGNLKQAPFVSNNDMPRFCTSVLPQVAGPLGLVVPEQWRDIKPEKCKLRFYLDRRLGMVSCRLEAVYQAKACEVTGSIDDYAGDPLRDQLGEFAGLQLVEQYFGQGIDNRFVLNDDSQSGIVRLLFEGLSQMRSLGEVFTTPSFDQLLHPVKSGVQLVVSKRGDLISLAIRSDDLPADELAAVFSSYREKRNFHRLKDGSYLDLRDADLDTAATIVGDLDLSDSQVAAGDVSLPAFRAFYLDAVLEREYEDDAFQSYINKFRAVDPERYQIPTGFKGELRAYQREGYRWLSSLADMGFGGVLADEMGLGKTVQMIAFLLAHRDEAFEVGPSLIVCPASLVYNWAAEFARFAPGFAVQVIAGTKDERSYLRTVAGSDVLITSYDLLRIDIDDYLNRTFFCEVLDEAQYIKNHNTKAARSAKLVVARHRFALTGTPIENRLAELWSIFDFLMPGLLGSRKRFCEHFEKPIAEGDKSAIERLRGAVAPFILRRRKADVLDDLPDKLESVVYAQLEGEQRRLYLAREQRLRESIASHDERELRDGKIEVLAELTRLRQICCDPSLVYEGYRGRAAKLETIMEVVAGAMESGEKILVFSQFTSYLAIIGARLEEQKVAYYKITGHTPKRRRLELVDAFNADETPVFLISLKAGGTGLNLVGASVVVHADPWWNAAAQDQATDRAHRIGQTQNVSVYRVIAKDTIEERILKMQEDKNGLANQIISGAGVSLSSLSKKDLLGLLS